MKKSYGTWMAAGVLLWLGAAARGEVGVTNVEVRQRYPWNGLVDVDYEVTGDEGARAWVTMSGLDEATGEAVTMWSLDGEGTGVLSGIGKHRATWDAGKDRPGWATGALRVKVEAFDAERLYMEVNMAEGAEGETWPVGWMDGPPEGGWGPSARGETLVLRLVFPGTGWMGSPEGETGRFGNEGRRETTLTEPYYIGVFETTQKQWELATGEEPSEHAGWSRPVENVSYGDIRGWSEGAEWPQTNSVDAESFLGVLREKTGLAFDLPTEAQWEWACRAGTATALYSGKELTDEEKCENAAELGRYAGNLDDGAGGEEGAGWTNHAATGSYAPNAWGLHDMSGNVAEWCLDWYDEELGSSAAMDPAGPSWGDGRVVRGGSWRENARGARSARRQGLDPSWTDDATGFRVACSATGMPRLGVVTKTLVPGLEATMYEAELEATGGEPPYSWTVHGEGYDENSRAGTFTASGEAQGWTGDDESHELALPFAFPFYGKTYDTCYVSDNGTIAFDGYFSQYWHDEETFLAHPMIAAMWADLYNDGMDVCVEIGATAVTVRWKTGYYGGGGEANFAATLHADGTIVLSYGAGNENGGFIGISAGDGENTLVASKSQGAGMSGAADVVFAPQGMPEGLELTEGGVLTGTVAEAGTYRFTAVVEDSAGATASRGLSLEVRENPALRPAVLETTPAEGAVNAWGLGSVTFEVEGSHPADGALAYEWRLDGETVEGATGREWTWARADGEVHTVTCVVSGEGLPKTLELTWRTGELSVEGPEDAVAAAGQTVVLGVAVASAPPAEVTWYDGEGNEAGTGETLILRNVAEGGVYWAVAQNALGAVTSRVATVTVTSEPVVGRAYRLTGPAFEGNRLVLRAAVYGDLTEASYSWKRDGVEVGTGERLEIAELGAGDFGTYALTVTTPLGTATGEGVEVRRAAGGVPVGWGADDHGRTTAPEGVTGIAAVASGMNFNLGLKTDGTVVAWGYNGHGGCDVPEGLGGVSSVAAGGYESQGAGFAVKKDGTVAAWGTPHQTEGYWNWRWVDEYDEDGDWIGEHQEEYWYEYTNGWDTVSTIPGDLTNVVKVAVGSDFAMALRADGTVATWGVTEHWRWNEEVGDWEEVFNPYEVPEGLEDVVDIAAGGQFALALAADGTVTAWGGYDGRAGMDVPATLADAVEVAATKGSAAAGFALTGNGGLVAWGDTIGWWDLPESGFTAVDCGQYHAMALDAAGNVSVWGGCWYNQDRVPAVVQGHAIGIAAGGYHCTALLADTDGDTVADAEEAALGRDPETWEPWERVGLSGRVTVAGAAPVHAVTVELLDALGGVRGRVTAGEDGSYAFEGLIPGVYAVRVLAAGAVDTVREGVRTLEGAADGVDFDLEEGQGQALAAVVPHTAGPEWTGGEEDGSCTPMELPEGMVVYLDLWPSSWTEDGKLELGEVAASHAELDGTALVPHIVTVKRPGADAQIPKPCEVAGEEGGTVEVNPHFSETSGSVRVTTLPSGADVWVDYADEPAGVTPLTVGNLSAAASHAHILLLKKEGYLRPRPIEFSVAPGETTDIDVELQAAKEGANEMTVAVSNAVAGMEIYLDYLPTGETAPATVGGLEAASHAGSGWASQWHTVLLRREGVRPYAARRVPEEWTWDEDAGDWVLKRDTELIINAPHVRGGGGSGGGGGKGVAADGTAAERRD